MAVRFPTPEKPHPIAGAIPVNTLRGHAINALRALGALTGKLSQTDKHESITRQEILLGDAAIASCNAILALLACDGTKANLHVDLAVKNLRAVQFQRAAGRRRARAAGVK